MTEYISKAYQVDCAQQMQNYFGAYQYSDVSVKANRGFQVSILEIGEYPNENRIIEKAENILCARLQFLHAQISSLLLVCIQMVIKSV